MDLILSIIQSVLPLVLFLSAYLLGSIGRSTIAKRRGLRHPWLAWIPVVREWQLGCLSDQHRFLTEGKRQNRRTTLLILSIIGAVVFCLLAVLILWTASHWLDAFSAARQYHMGGSNVKPDTDSWSLICMLLGVLLLALVYIGTAAARLVVRSMALYDLYSSCAPGKAAALLIPSVICSLMALPITEAVIIFLLRNRADQAENSIP